MNYGTAVNATKAAIEDENVAIAPVHLAIEVAIDKLNASQATIAKAKAVFANMGVDGSSVIVSYLGQGNIVITGVLYLFFPLYMVYWIFPKISGKKT